MDINGHFSTFSLLRWSFKWILKGNECTFLINTYSALLPSILLLSHVWLYATPWAAAYQASLSITSSWSLLELVSIESVMPSNQLILCRPLLLPSIFPSNGVFSSESVLCIRWPKCWSFSISPFNDYLVLISFRMDWLDPLAVQGTLKSLLQHHNTKASILRCSVLFLVQLSHSSMTTGKTIALTRWTFVGKVMSLVCNMLSRLVIAFLPRSKRPPCPHFRFISFWLNCFTGQLNTFIVVVQLLSHVLWLFWDLMDYSPPDSCVHGISRPESWSRLPFPPPGDLSPVLQANSLLMSHIGTNSLVLTIM